MDGKEASDGSLAVAAVLGDLEAFGELVRRYQRATIRVAAAIAGPEQAEDVAQESFLIAFRALPDLEDPARFAAWLGAITRNRANRWARQEARLPRVEFDETLLGYFDAASQQRRGADAAEELVEQLNALPDEYGPIMRMRWLDEMSMEQIGAFTGLPISTVKWRLHHGKKLLREGLLPIGENQDGTGKNRKRDRNSQADERALPYGTHGSDESVDHRRRS